jgi:opacity protein-like surface antigen
MKKIALLGLLSVAVMANESGLYVGGEVGKTHQEDVEYGVNITNNSTSYEINGGYYINQNSRAYAFYSYISKGDYASHTNVYGIGYDYLIGTSPLKPFVGAIVGYSTFTNNSFHMNGMAYGGQVGVDYSVNGKLSVDAGYKYLESNAKEASSEAKNFSAFFIGAAYKF